MTSDSSAQLTKAKKRRAVRLSALITFAICFTVSVVGALLVLGLAIHRQKRVPPETGVPAVAIPALLTQQAADWNRGDLDAFATGYKNSPDILFIGRKTSRGYDGMLASYRQGYASREKMGTLSFSQLEVQMLDAHFATTTGHYHLERSAAGGGNADGYFLLVLENTASGWKIVRDDTTSLPPPAKP